MSTHNRRSAIKNMVAGSAAVVVGGNMLSSFTQPGEKETAMIKFKGNINHSVCRWCFNDFSVEDLCKAVKQIGFSAIDLIGPADWHILQQYGVYSSMCYTSGENSLTKGWNDKSQHARLIKDHTDIIPLMVQAGYKDVICFSGNRNGMDDETGLKNCVEGLQQVLPLAEKNGITIHMELLNSKVNHKDYMCDRTPWGVELCKRLNSNNFKLLYDIYHMQIDEGDVIRTIKDNSQYIGHYHTAGVPGRHEIDETQELYYPAIMNAIKEMNFKGYVAQEFIPKAKDKLASLKKAVEICDV
ncbi:hydroxypyruvate isomerase family protein [Pinibacter soli]|uniref:TIM barrel protein n=1 Tax=Pinibacter soli TaxID=3044211 RepID=A0ABT6RB06_9BACT|nr:TIM barrel protein [Pinibacter soli]MDI3319743.1 TIM barrel protein [Pinibacter soli]